MADKDLMFKPNDVVKTCKYLEKALCFEHDGLFCCVLGTLRSPCIASAEEIQKGNVNYDLIIQRKKDLFLALNGKKDMDISSCKICSNIIEKKYKDVCLDTIGGERLPAMFNIQHYSECNERCIFCSYTKENVFCKPQYDILKIWEMFREKGKLKGNSWIDFSGGEPTLLKNFKEIVEYTQKHKIGQMVVYSNASIYSPVIYEALKKNKIILTTSIDSGTKSTYAKIRGADLYDKVISNLIRYRNSGTNCLWLKYVVTDSNRTDDDMWGFVMTMSAIRPNRIFICPDFPYGDRDIPDETVKFVAKLWYLLEKYVGDIVSNYTEGMGDAKFIKYHKDLKEELCRLKEENPISADMRLKQYKGKNTVLYAILKKIRKFIPKNKFFDKIVDFCAKLLIPLGYY